MQDEKGTQILTHGGILIVELNKFEAQTIGNELERWVRFFNEGEGLNEAHLPEWMQTVEMKQAMETLKQFSEKDRAYDRYQARQNYLRQQRSMQWDLEQARLEKETTRAALVEKDVVIQEKDNALQEKEAVIQEKDKALETLEATKNAEIEKLKKLLGDRMR